MPTLFEYLQQTQRLIHDQKQVMINQTDLIRYVNLARREVAMRSQCLRVLTPVSGSVMSVAVTNPGSGYTDPTVTITAPDFPAGQGPYPNGLQAEANITQIGGTIAGINIDNGGYGYFQPEVIINDPTGTGATAVASISPTWQTAAGQEVYKFSSIDLSAFPGYGVIFMVLGVSIIYANYRYSLPVYSFSTYQARIRQYPLQYQYVPTIGAQYGRGEAGSFYLYPISSQAYQMEFDCFCLPQDLGTDQDVEAIPQPWNDAVPYFAAYLAFMELQNFNSARILEDQFNKFMSRYSSYTQPGRLINPYGRY